MLKPHNPRYLFDKGIAKRDSEDFYENILIRVEGDILQDFAGIKKTRKQFNADELFIFSFMEDDFEALYIKEQVTETLFKLFAGLGYRDRLPGIVCIVVVYR
ncbi:MAG: hypothetical protein ABIS36_23215 [Chryseolinea sp.]